MPESIGTTVSVETQTKITAIFLKNISQEHNSEKP
jgi:hypothetical protein